MAWRLTDTEKWDDDWFLNLPPRHKCMWELLRDTCNGAGLKKVSFKKFSDSIGEEITREDFDKHFSGRVHWVNEELLWIPGIIFAQCRNFSFRNKAHVNIAKLAIRTVSSQSLPPKAQDVLNKLLEVVAQADAVRPSDDPRAPSKLNNIKETIKKKRIKKGESEGKTEYTPEFQKFWDIYPKKVEKSEAFKEFQKFVFTSEVESLYTATYKYVAYLETSGQYAKNPTTFLHDRKWLNCLEPDFGQVTNINASTTQPKADYWLLEADYYFQALKQFSVTYSYEESKKAADWLGDIRMKRVRLIGGLSFVQTLPRDSFARKKLADMLKGADEQLNQAGAS